MNCLLWFNLGCVGIPWQSAHTKGKTQQHLSLVGAVVDLMQYTVRAWQYLEAVQIELHQVR